MGKHRFVATPVVKISDCFALLVMLLFLALFAAAAAADDGVCARVKIEIRQELTLERQAFDAHMRINNALSHITLEDIDIDVFFSDEDDSPVLATSDPADAEAKFFIRLDSMANIDDVNGAGTVAPSSSANIHWLIIPSAGCSNGREAGTLYFVGARLTYRIGGEEHVTEVAPDHIYVKPLPELALDYFLPTDVYGDDPFTPAIEPATAFSLGVRVKNNGFGAARALKIDSAQPRIVENEQGLLIGFVIEGSEVQGQPATNSLLADFGDIPPGSAKMARWRMHCTLSGRFVAFDAAFSHSNELGGELTSLVQGVNTHTLVRDVRVDLPGRDTVVDFLAKDGDIYRVYESDSADTVVENQSAAASLQADGDRYRLTAPATAGFMYVSLPDPLSGSMVISGITRADGKRIKLENAWLSKFQDPDTHAWHHFISLFDANTPGAYSIAFENPANLPQPPVVQFIPDRTRVEGQQLSFIVEASDPNGTIPALAASGLPAGAAFTDGGDGTGIFNWTPAVGQAGRYPVTFTATDGALSASRRTTLAIFPIGDTDGDGMLDSWEVARFGTLARDGIGDFDGDGLTDLEEFLAGTDPSRENHGPSVPGIAAPLANEAATVLAPTLVITNSTDPDGDALTYEFELFADPEFKNPVAKAAVPEGTDTTAWTVSEELLDNHPYYWRVRADDGTVFSLWVHGRFFVNTVNDPPGDYFACRPWEDTAVDTLSPVLSVTRARDLDGDPLAYTFEVYADSPLSELVASGSGAADAGAGTVSWQVDGDPLLEEGGRYYWRAVAADPHGAESRSLVSSFTVKTSNSAPSAPFVAFPASGGEISGPDVLLTVSNALDADGDPLTYHFELDRVDTFDSGELTVSGPVSEGTETTAWAVSGLTENVRYFWRVKAADGSAESPWVAASFFVSGANDPPPAAAVKNPGDGAWVDTLSPTLSVHPAKDPDNDPLSYQFEVYADKMLTDLVAESGPAGADWAIPAVLVDKTRYFWTVQAVDGHGTPGEWNGVSGFFVNQTPPEELSAVVVTDQDRALSDVPVYAFTEAGDYTGRHATTESDGTALFSLADFNPGVYQLRADYLGHRFWTDPFSLPENSWVQLVIPEENVTVTVAAPEGIEAGVPVYLFSTAGAYLGATGKTDETGRVRFDLPTGGGFKFRADLQGNSYWSELITVEEGAVNSVGVAVGGGRLRVTLEADPETPMAGVPVYLFNDAGAYLGAHQTTDEGGMAEFSVAEGCFKLRADYLGYQFWSEDIPMAADAAVTVTIPHQDVPVRVQAAFENDLEPLPDVPVYLFSPTGAYLNQSLWTDDFGKAVLRLPERAYRVRADHLQHQFWSEPFTWQEATVAVPMAEAEITVAWSGLPLEGVPVYAFTDTGSYLNRSAASDAAGAVSFRLPAGHYKFRADYQGSRYWSAETALAADRITPVAISTGGGTFTLSVAKGNEDPLAGVSCYVFSGTGAYLNLNGATDSSGAVAFDLAEGTYLFRIDYLGEQFWTEPIRVPEALEHAVVIPHHDLRIRVEGDFSGDVAPKPDAPVYLFNTSGAYLSVNGRTDAAGEVFFSLPEKPFKVRVDLLGQQFWSEVFSAQDATVMIPEATARVRVVGTGQALGGVPVYAFSAADAYLNLHQTTGSDGFAAFRLPAGSYKFRADYQGSRYWASAGLSAGILHDVSLDTGGGQFVFSVDTGSGPLGDTRVYAFNGAGVYLGVYGVTNADGQAAFNLADGSYTFRVDHLGYPFWSPVYAVPDQLSGVFSIPHQDVAVAVVGDFPETEPLAGVKVYLFTPAGAYLNRSWTTDSEGRVSFTLPDRDYQVRVDHLGQQFWSETFSLQDQVVTIHQGAVDLAVSRGGAALNGARVYVFSEAGAYLGIYRDTDAFGEGRFVLPDRSFKFRLDVDGEQHWTETVAVQPGAATPVAVDLDE